MIAIVCGGRDFTDAARMKAVMDKAVHTLGVETIIEGAALGADTLAYEWAMAHGGVSVIHVPADWAKYGRAAGAIRNATMLRILLGGDPDTKRAVFAFPGGNGTKNMVALARSPDAVKGRVRVIEL